MCGRYSFVAEDALIHERFGIRVRTAIYKANYNCSPTQKLAVITNRDPDMLQFFRWGLIPSWTKPDSGRQLPLLINARAETLAEKPSFRQALRSRRCLVPATGFYEWKTEPGSSRKISVHFRLRSGEPFAMAGLWDQWKSPEGEDIFSFTIITTAPNQLIAGIHDRMPVLLSREDESAWLVNGPESNPGRYFTPYPPDEMIQEHAPSL